MSGPTRWLDGQAPAGAGALLRAGLAEKPSRQVLQRTLAAVSATAVASTAVGGALGATAQVATSSTLVFVAKCAAIGVVSASVMLGSAIGLQHYRTKAATRQAIIAPIRSASKPWPVSSTARRMTTDSSAPLVSATQLRLANSASTPPALAAPNAAPTSVAGSAVPTSRTRPERSSSTAEPVRPESTQAEPELVDEMDVIDAARLRLRSGDPTGALQRINDYDLRSDFRRLAPEALYIRMEAQLQLGNRVAAAAAAKEMLFRYPRAAQVRRATEILEVLGAQ